MRLNKSNLWAIEKKPGLVIPGAELFYLPEKVLQFGTGVLLRGLPDYFIDKANRAGIFNGRIVVVKSTPVGSPDGFDQQNSLYTLCIRGLVEGRLVDENIIHSCISRVLTAQADWAKVLEVAVSKDLQVVFSNTTEVGITFVPELIGKDAPVSFPGKLLAVLAARFRQCGGISAPGLVIVPAELITDNGVELKRIVTRLAVYNNMDEAFMQWLNEANYFCNSLVDRIVPGKLPPSQQQLIEDQLGYEDGLMIMAEEYRLWAIESDSPVVKKILSFSQADEGVVICDDITRYKELKLRVLNGSHSLGCGLALLMGFRTVKEAMADPVFYTYMSGLVYDEIVPATTGPDISETDARHFASQVLERFQNPALDHQWENISAQFSLKMRMRVVDSVKQYTARQQQVPPMMVRGFAAYIRVLTMAAASGGQFINPDDGAGFIVKDQLLTVFATLPADAAEQVETILGNTELWQEDLNLVPGFTAALSEAMAMPEENNFLNRTNKQIHG